MPPSLTNITRLENSAGSNISGAIADMAAGSLMACVMASYAATAGASSHVASDSENATYSTIVNRSNQSGASTTVGLSMHYFQNSVAGSASSGNASGGTGVLAVTAVFYEVAGCATVSALGGSTGSTGASSSPNTGDVTPSNSSAFMLAAMNNNDGSNPILYNINLTNTVGTYSQNTSSGRELNGATFATLGTAYQVISGGSSQRHVWQSTNGANSDPWNALLAAFVAPAGGGAAAARPLFPAMGAGR